MESWFVYYKVTAADADAALARAQRVVAALRDRTAAPPRVMRKLDGADHVTLMEVYDNVRDPEAFASALAAALSANGFAADEIARRRVERFVQTPSSGATVVSCA